MNPKVQEILDKKKAEELQRRNEHLISLGLVDEEKSSSIVYDEENQLSYDIENFAIEVTDEEYAEICKYYPEEVNIESNQYTELKMKKDISSIKFWVKFWSIFSIVCGAIAFIGLIANR